MSSIKLIRNGTQPENLLQELNRQRKRNQLCEVKLVVDNNVFYAHQCVLAASSTFFYKLLTIDRPELDDDIEVVLKKVTAVGMRDVLSYIYGEDICVSEDTVESLLKTSLSLSVKDLTNDILKYMISILEPRNCLRMLRIARRNNTTRFYLAVKRFICQNLDAVSAQDAFYFLSENEMEKILSSDDVRIDSETHLYEIILAWTNLDVDLRKKHFPCLFKYVRLQLIPQDYLMDSICTQELVKAFSSCRDAVDNALMHLVRPDRVSAQEKRPQTYSEEEKVFIATQTQIITISDDRVSVEIEFPRGARERSSVVDGTKVVICGGTLNGGVSSEVSQYDGKKWTSLPSLMYPRYGAAIVSYKGNLYVFGGSLSADWPDAKFADKVEKLESDGEEWSLVSFTPSKRSHMCSVVLDETVYLLGGYVSLDTKDSKDRLNSWDTLNENKSCERKAIGTAMTEIYIPSSNWWHSGPHMTKKRVNFCAQTFRQQIFVFGGDLTGDNTAEIYHQFDNCWTAVTTHLPTIFGRLYFGKSLERVYLTSVLHEPERAWSCSFTDQDLNWKSVEPECGSSADDESSEEGSVLNTNPGKSSYKEKTKELSEPSADNSLMLACKNQLITIKSGTSSGRTIWHKSAKHYAVACSKDRIVFCGGLGKNNLPISDVMEYSDSGWKTLPSMKEPRAGASAVLAKESLYVLGGCDQSQKWMCSAEKLGNFASSFQTIASMANSRTKCVAAHHQGSIYVFGEVVFGPKGISPTFYSIENDKWTDLTTFIICTSGYCAHAFGDRIYLADSNCLLGYLDLASEAQWVQCISTISLHVPLKTIVSSTVVDKSIYFCTSENHSNRYSIWTVGVPNGTKILKHSFELPVRRATPNLLKTFQKIKK